MIPRRPRAIRAFASGAALLAITLAAAVLPWAAAAQELFIYRSIYEGQSGRPESALAPGAPVELREQRLVVEGATALRVQSPDPTVKVVTRVGPIAPDDPTALVLTVIVVKGGGRFDFQYEQGSQVLRSGTVETRRVYAVGAEGLSTALASAEGRVLAVRIQDDGGREVRVGLEEGLLAVTLVPPERGGNPSGGPLPFYFGITLTFLDYDVLGGGYSDNFLAEARLGDHFAVWGNGFIETEESVYLGRAVVRQELMRRRHWSVALEGGGAVYSRDPVVETDTKDSTPTWVFGTTGTLRFGDWGGALHAATVDGDTVVTVLAGWQALQSIGVFLSWQSFLGHSGSGLGLTIDL